jgi:hypothetical protein
MGSFLIEKLGKSPINWWRPAFEETKTFEFGFMDASLSSTFNTSVLE